jgi:hypothetical protein
MRILKSSLRFFVLTSLVVTAFAVSTSKPAPSSRDGKQLAGDSASAERLTVCPDGYPVNCGDGYCCKPGRLCCGGGSCCPGDTPHFCPVSNMCYKYYSDAQKDCGNDYKVCGRPSG